MEKLSSHTIANKNGMKVRLCNYGARVMSIICRDRNGLDTDVALGYDRAESYPGSHDPYFGATVGRFANRISGGRFALQGTEYRLSLNDPCGPNHVHGGSRGFSQVTWEEDLPGPLAVEYRYLSAHMEEGYPGNLDVRVRYSLTEDNSLLIEYRAHTDRITILNLTNHTFFNLHGPGPDDVLDHQLFIRADQFTPVDRELLPLGRNIPVRNTPFDFLEPRTIGSRIRESHEQLEIGRGYCHNYVLTKSGAGLPDAVASSPRTGIGMEMYTTEPGLQFYSCGFMDGSDIGKGGTVYGESSAFCLEAQHFPDSPNQDGFPSTILEPGEEYRQRTVYKFFVDHT